MAGSTSASSGSSAVGLDAMAGGFVEVTDPEVYTVALEAIYEAYSLYSLPFYEVVSVYEQIVAGKNFIIKLQHFSSSLDYAIFKVYANLEGETEVTLQEQVQVTNYSLN